MLVVPTLGTANVCWSGSIIYWLALVDEQQPLCARVRTRDSKYERGSIAIWSATVALEITIPALHVSEEVTNVPPFTLI